MTTALRDAIDHTALGWVKPEIDEALRQARIELEAFAEAPGDPAPMQTCIDHLHQVQGTLRMLELQAPAMVAGEMEQLAAALHAGGVPARDEALAVLMRGVVQLPDYLERLQGGHRDIPIVLLPLINALRVARGAPELGQDALPSLLVAPTEAELEHARGSLAGRNRALLDTVAAAIKEDLLKVKDALDLFLRAGHGNVQELQPQVEALDRIGETLGMLGLDSARAVVQEQRRIVHAITSGTRPFDEGALLDVAGALIYIDHSLDDQVAHLGAGGQDADAGDLLAQESRKVMGALTRAAISNFSEVRNAFVAFVETDWDHATLEPVPRLLSEVAGALRILEQPVPAGYLDALRQFTQHELVERRQVPGGQTLDTLADALASMEYFLESLHDPLGQRLDLLDKTRASLEALRYWPLPAEPVAAAPAAADEAAATTATASGTDAVDEADAKAEVAAGLAAEASAAAEAAKPAAVAVDVVPAAAAMAAGFESAGDEIDDEIREIFLEEFQDEIANLDALLPAWRMAPEDAEALRPIRRVFHTLKGSGRLVGAKVLGEFAWHVENMLNRVLDGSRPASPAVVAFVGQARELLPALHAALRDGAAVAANIPAMEAVADRLAAGEDVLVEAAPVAVVAGSEAATPVEPVSVAPAEPETAVVLVDPVLLEILGAEVGGHLETMQAWLAAARAGEAQADSTLLRAIHTLNGAFAMSEVPTVTAFTAPAEGYVKRLLAAKQPADADGLAALAEVAEAVRASTLALQVAPMQVPVYAALAARMAALRDTLPEASLPFVDHAQLAAEEAERQAVEEAARQEAERLAAEQAAREEAERQAAEEAARQEAERLAAEQAAREEAERQAAEEAARQQAERLAAEQAAREEAERQAAEEAARQEAERLAAEQAAREEAERQAAEEAARQQAERLAAEQAAREEAERQAAEEAARQEAERLAAEQAAREEAERQAAEEAARQEAERLAAEQAAREEAERQAAEEAARQEAERLAAEQAAREEAERQAAEEAARQEAERLAAEQAAAEAALLEAERLAAEQAEAERLAAEEAARAEAERLAAEQAAAEEAARREAERREAERIAAARAEAERLEAERIAAARAEAERREAERLEAERIAAAKARELAALAALQSTAAAAEDPDEALDTRELDLELVDIFVEEAGDLLDHSDGLLAQLREAPDDNELIVGLQRDLHTLKGGARMAGVMAAGELGHAMETLLEAVAAQRVELGDAGVALLERGFDRLHTMITRIAARRAIGMPDGLIDEFNARAENRAPAAAEAPARPEAPAPKPVLAPLSAPIRPEGAFEDDEIGVRAPQEQVRIRADLLDRLVNYAGEVAIYRARLEQQLSAFRSTAAEMEQTNLRLRDQLRRLDAETEAQIIARFQRESDSGREAFDPLELDRFSTLQQLSRALAESAADLQSLHGSMEDLTRQYETLLTQQSRVSSELQEGLMRTRMLPFDSLVPRLRRVIRQAAAETGKQAQLRVEGAQGELDRNVLERMTAPLEHMLRNAIAHGLETPQARQAAGKPEEGSIRVAVRREGAEVVLQISDDGAGLNRAAIRARGIERGLISADAVLTDAELDQLIMQPGFSTAETVSRLAGRGVGMDVVASEVRQLGGSIDIASRPGAGTTFTLRLPQTLAVTQAVFVKIGETEYAVPIAAVRGVGRISREQLAQAGAAYRYGGEDYALHDLGVLVGTLPAKAEGHLQMPLLLVGSGELRAAVAVDQVLGSREIVVKTGGPQLASVPGIFGATIMGDGRVVVILDVAPLVRRQVTLAASGALQHEVTAPAETRRVPLVMVVDDSVTMRKVTGRVLERHGFEVATAKDGLDALERMAELVPDLMLLDIEMPRMDGYELATAMKADVRLRDVPIVMITSRTGEKHRQRAMEIGVERYLGKPYQEPELMRNVFELLKLEYAGDGLAQ